MVEGCVRSWSMKSQKFMNALGHVFYLLDVEGQKNTDWIAVWHSETCWISNAIDAMAERHRAEWQPRTGGNSLIGIPKHTFMRQLGQTKHAGYFEPYPWV